MCVCWRRRVEYGGSVSIFMCYIFKWWCVGARVILHPNVSFIFIVSLSLKLNVYWNEIKPQKLYLLVTKPNQTSLFLLSNVMWSCKYWEKNHKKEINICWKLSGVSFSYENELNQFHDNNTNQFGPSNP